MARPYATRFIGGAAAPRRCVGRREVFLFVLGSWFGGTCFFLHAAHRSSHAAHDASVHATPHAALRTIPEPVRDDDDAGPPTPAPAPTLDRSKLGALAEPWDAAVGPAYVEVATAADWLAYDPSRASAARDGAAVLPLVADIGPKFAIQAGPGGPAAALPLFVIAGAQKGGTTYLRQVLNEHPMLDAGHGWFGKGKCGSEIHLLLTMAVVANRIEAAGGISSPKGRSILASHVSRYANAFRFPTCRGVAAPPAPPAPPLFFFDSTPSLMASGINVPRNVRQNVRALVETAFANGAPPRLLEGTRLVLRGQTRVVIMLRDPVDRYRSALAMENCRHGVARPNGRTGLDERKGPNRPAHNASEPEKTSTYHDRYAKPNAMKKYLRAFEAAEPRAMFDEAFGPLVRSRYRPLCAELLESFPDTLVPVKTEDFFADPMATANKLLATLGLPRFTMTASDLDSLHKREATCDVSSIFSRSNAATLRAWLATDGDLDLRDLGPGFEAMAWVTRLGDEPGIGITLTHLLIKIYYPHQKLKGDSILPSTSWAMKACSQRRPKPSVIDPCQRDRRSFFDSWPVWNPPTGLGAPIEKY